MPVPVYPEGHPSPRNLSDLLAGVFQSCWVSPDFDAAIAQLERLGMEFPIRFEPEVDFVVGSRTEHVSLKAALGTAADGALAVEVLQPVDDPTGVFTSLLDGSSGGARFHHFGILTPDLGLARGALRADGLDYAIIGGTAEAEFGLVDLTATLGHYLELIHPFPEPA